MITLAPRAVWTSSTATSQRAAIENDLTAQYGNTNSEKLVSTKTDGTVTVLTTESGPKPLAVGGAPAFAFDVIHPARIARALAHARSHAPLIRPAAHPQTVERSSRRQLGGFASSRIRELHKQPIVVAKDLCPDCSWLSSLPRF
jgi:hypothetical protein